MDAGKYFGLDSPTANYYVWYRIGGVGTDPAIPGQTGIRVDLTEYDSPATVNTKTATAIDALADFGAVVNGSAVRVTNVTNGDVTPTSATISDLLISTIQNGSSGTNGVDPITDKLTVTSHGLATGTKVRVSSSGTMPTGLSSGTDYYVIDLGTNELKLASSLDSAMAGSAVNITSSGSGTITLTTRVQSDSHTATTSDISVTTQDEASNLIDIMDSALPRLETALAQVSAVSSRLDFTYELNQKQVETFTNAHSALTQTDYALEVAELVRQQILANVQMAVLAQANLNASMVLKLFTSLNH